MHIWGLLCQKRISRAGTSNYTPQHLWGVITCPCPWYLLLAQHSTYGTCHDDVIKWKHFPRYWPFVRGIHRSPVNSQHKGQWRGALMFSLICVWINGWVNTREAGDLRRYRAHYDVIVMYHELYTRFAHCCDLILIEFAHIVQDYITSNEGNHTIVPGAIEAILK